MLTFVYHDYSRPAYYRALAHLWESVWPEDTNSTYIHTYIDRIHRLAGVTHIPYPLCVNGVGGTYVRTYMQSSRFRLRCIIPQTRPGSSVNSSPPRTNDASLALCIIFNRADLPEHGASADLRASVIDLGHLCVGDVPQFGLRACDVLLASLEVKHSVYAKPVNDNKPRAAINSRRLALTHLHRQYNTYIHIHIHT